MTVPCVSTNTVGLEFKNYNVFSFPGGKAGKQKLTLYVVYCLNLLILTV